MLGVLAMLANADVSGSGAGEINQTLTCIARSIQGPVEFPFPVLVPFVVRCVPILYFVYICFFGVALNIWTPYLVWKFKFLQTLSFSFAVQISILNIFSSLTIAFCSMISAMTNKWLLGEVMCIIIGSIHFFTQALRGQLMMVFVTHRFCLIFMPYWYPRHRAKIVYTLQPIAYVVALLASIIPGAFQCYSFSPVPWICQWDPTCSAECTIVRPVLGLGVLIIFNFLPLLLYIALYCKAKRPKSSVQEASDIAGQKKEWRAMITFFFLFLALFRCCPPRDPEPNCYCHQPWYGFP